MTQKSVYLPLEANNMAEGSTEIENTELADHLKTRTVPIVGSDADRVEHAAETGLISAIDVSVEGKDNGDAQDASLTTDETHKAPIADRSPAGAKDKAPLVLIVEDTTELAEIIQATLERMNMVTVHETHGIKALAKFNELNPDVILLDISLPDMTGWKIMDVIKERREHGLGKMPIVIIITAYDDPANRLVGKLQGVHSYLIKPFTSDEIEHVVTQAITSTTQ